MVVIVHLHTILQIKTSRGLIRRLEYTLPAGSTVGDLVADLDVGLPIDSILIAVNGRVAPTDKVLTEGDEINLMPAISGGNGVNYAASNSQEFSGEFSS